MSALANIVLGGTVDSAILGVAAFGFSLQFSVTNYVNFAYGELVTFGAFMALMFNETLHQGLWISLIGAGFATALLSAGLGQGVYWPFFRRRPQVLYVLVVSFAMSLILGNIWLIIWGTSFREFQFSGTNPSYNVGPFHPTRAQGIAIIMALVVLLALWLLLHRTRLGKSMRAVADDRALAGIAGLNTRAIVTNAWLLSGFLAGIAGVLEAQLVVTFDTTLGSTFLWLIIAGTLVGGIGRPAAALAGAIVIGFGEQLGVYVFGATLAPAAVFLILVVILLFRPKGLFSGRTTLQNA